MPPFGGPVQPRAEDKAPLVRNAPFHLGIETRKVPPISNPNRRSVRQAAGRGGIAAVEVDEVVEIPATRVSPSVEIIDASDYLEGLGRVEHYVAVEIDVSRWDRFPKAMSVGVGRRYIDEEA